MAMAVGSWQLSVASCQLAIESRVLRLSALGFGIWFLVFGFWAWSGWDLGNGLLGRLFNPSKEIIFIN